ncbi:hypothetical protein GCM10010896_18310 [Mammaliicoccus stepanovicii]|nr:hypothetical protein GCM10010896_18310 [Mammaliicoccus stepanovicii]
MIFHDILQSITYTCIQVIVTVYYRLVNGFFKIRYFFNVEYKFFCKINKPEKFQAYLLCFIQTA